jgi:hypothetical protein
MDPVAESAVGVQFARPVVQNTSTRAKPMLELVVLILESVRSSVHILVHADDTEGLEGLVSEGLQARCPHSYSEQVCEYCIDSS